LLQPTQYQFLIFYVKVTKYDYNFLIYEEILIINKINIDQAVDIGRRVKSSRMLAGLSRKDLNEKYKISAATLRSWEDPEGTGKNGLTKKGAIRLINALKDAGVACSVSWLMTGRGSGPTLKNESFCSFELPNITWDEEESIFQEIEYFKQINNSSIITLINDTGMEPIYEKNSYVGGIKVFGYEIDNLVGLNCIVESKNHGVLVRRLQRDTTEGKYRLMCINPSIEIKKPIITDLELESAAEIVWHRKRSTRRGV
jgi:transcriptional regulator with XRE-family HTH domain